MANKYRFTYFNLNSATGFAVHAFPPVETFSEGLNIIYGPNGVGKSTLLEALHALLFTYDGKRQFSAHATLETENEQYSLERNKHVLQQKRLSDNQDLELTGRNDTFRDAYVLALHELLQIDTQATAVFSSYIKKQMQGGIDLSKAYADTGASSTFSSSRINQTQEYQQCYNEFKKLEKDLIENASLKDELDDLEKQLAEGEKLKQSHQTLLKLHEYLSNSEDQKSIETQMEAFDERVASLRKESEQDAVRLKKELEQASNVLDDEENLQSTLSKDFLACNIEETLLTDRGFKDLLGNRIEAFKDEHEKLENAKKARRDAISAIEEWQNQHSFLINQADPSLKHLLSELTRLASSCESVRTKLASKNAIVESFEEPQKFSEQELQNLEELRTACVSTLSALSKLEACSLKKFPKLRYLLIGSLVGISLAPWMLPYSLIIAVVLFSLSSYLTLRSTNNPQYQELKLFYEQHLMQLKQYLGSSTFETPDNFSKETVSTLYIQILNRLGTAKITMEKQSFLRKVKTAQQDAQTAYDTWRSEYEKLSDALHLSSSPVLEGAQFFHLSEHLLHFCNLCELLEQAKNEELDCKSSYNDARNILKQTCACSADEHVELLSQAQAYLASYVEAVRLSKELEVQKVRVAQARSAFEQKQKTYEHFFISHGLETGDHATLQLLSQQIEKYQGLVDNKRAVVAQMTLFSDEIVSLSQGHSLDEVALLLDSVSEKLKSYEQKQEQYWTMAERYRNLCSNEALDQAQMKLGKVREALEQRRREEVEKQFLHALITDLQKAAETTYQPQVLKQASSWFLRITNNRFSLGISDETFFARDEVQKRPYDLHELSSGTKVQLLFALRLGFIENLESGSGYHFPLFFDELMAISDDERSLAIAQSVSEIAKYRQVLYATAQADEVEKLMRYSKEAIQIIDLEQQNREYQASRRPFSAPLVLRKELIEPLDDYNEYAKALKIPQPDLFESMGELSSWYLCTDSEELFALLKRGFDLAGQARLSDSRYHERYDLLSEAQELARQGRARTITVQDLEDPELSINRQAGFYTAIKEFIAETNCNGNELLEAIEHKVVKRMNESTRDALESWLLKQGFATDDERYEADQIMSMLLLRNPQLSIEHDDTYIVQRYLESVGVE